IDSPSRVPTSLDEPSFNLAPLADCLPANVQRPATPPAPTAIMSIESHSSLVSDALVRTPGAEVSSADAFHGSSPVLFPTSSVLGKHRPVDENNGFFLFPLPPMKVSREQDVKVASDGEKVHQELSSRQSDQGFVTDETATESFAESSVPSQTDDSIASLVHTPATPNFDSDDMANTSAGEAALCAVKETSASQAAYDSEPTQSDHTLRSKRQSTADSTARSLERQLSTPQPSPKPSPARSAMERLFPNRVEKVEDTIICSSTPASNAQPSQADDPTVVSQCPAVGGREDEFKEDSDDESDDGSEFEVGKKRRRSTPKQEPTGPRQTTLNEHTAPTKKNSEVLADCNALKAHNSIPLNSTPKISITMTRTPFQDVYHHPLAPNPLQRKSPTMGKCKCKGKDKPRKFYPVRAGRTPGMYYNWWDCKEQVHEYKGAECMSSETHDLPVYRHEEDAWEFLKTPTVSERIAAREGGSAHPVQTGRVTKRAQSSRVSRASLFSQLSSSPSQVRTPCSETLQSGVEREEDILAVNDRMMTLMNGDTMTITRSHRGFNFDVTPVASPSASFSSPSSDDVAPVAFPSISFDDIIPSTDIDVIDLTGLSDSE
ncbi:ribonuclease h, partial [Fusarium flagelliforme]